MRELMAKYADVELLVKIGEYKSGSDAVTVNSMPASLSGSFNLIFSGMTMSQSSTER